MNGTIALHLFCDEIHTQKNTNQTSKKQNPLQKKLLSPGRFYDGASTALTTGITASQRSLTQILTSEPAFFFSSGH